MSERDEIAEAAFTAAELNEFDALTMRLSSLNNLVRIEARLDIKAFEEKHGKAKCEAMFAELKRRDGP